VAEGARKKRRKKDGEARLPVGPSGLLRWFKRVAAVHNLMTLIRTGEFSVVKRVGSFHITL
jgi:hypothetical protein